MSNRRVKSVGYDDDDFDYDDQDFDQDGEEEISPEDKEQLRIGTIKVKEALGREYMISESEIHEALWHYYYDVDKSVSYLKNKHKPKSFLNSKAAEVKGYDWIIHELSTTTLLNPWSDGPALAHLPYDGNSSVSIKEFFADCPWLSIPKHRQAKIILHNSPTQRGLLGGSAQGSKMSKLAQLAAKRRQKENQASPAAPITDANNADEYASNLSKLTLGARQYPKKGTLAVQSETGDMQDSSEVTADEYKPNPDQVVGVGAQTDGLIPQVSRAAPSSFARTILAGNAARQSSVVVSRFSESTQVVFDFSQPSPDDVVGNAQSGKSPPVGTKLKSKDSSTPRPSVLNNIENLKIHETTKIKSKNIDVLSEYHKQTVKNAVSLVVIGHVDAGKSTLMGRLLFDLRAIDERTMEKYQREADKIGKGSFAFAWVLDQGSEERERGVTIDIATNTFETTKTKFTILDAPGHQDFVPNMIAGASQADFAVLVIDATGSNFESGLRGQTREHALLARSIGVQKIIVAINKMDAIDWNMQRFEDIQGQMSAFLITAGFQVKNLVFIPCSGLVGSNILTRTSDEKASWYKGPTLVEEMDNFDAVKPSMVKPLRMAISDVFRGSIQNPVSISGRIETGTLQVGESIIIMPSGEQASIRSIELDNDPVEWAVAGQNVVLNLIDIDPVHLKAGDMVCSSVSPIHNVEKLKAKILAFTTLMPQLVDIHRGRLHIPGRIAQLDAILDKTTSLETKKRPKIAQPNSVVRVSVKLDSPVPLEAGQRIIFRAGGETIAAGLIE